MKSRLIIAVAAAAFLAPITPSAFARDSGRYSDRDHRYDSHQRDERYIVHFHLDGERKVYAGSHWRAHRLEDLFNSIGARAHIDG